MFWRSKKRKEEIRKAKDYDQIDQILTDYKTMHRRVVDFLGVFNQSGKRIKTSDRLAIKDRLIDILDKLKDRL